MLRCRVMGSRVIMFGNYSSMDCMQNRVQIPITYRNLGESEGGVNERHFEKYIYVCLLIILFTFTIRFSKLKVPR